MFSVNGDVSQVELPVVFVEVFLVLVVVRVPGLDCDVSSLFFRVDNGENVDAVILFP